MNSSQRLLILTGLALISFTMAFGTWYAIFDEHQTLTNMGIYITTGFTEAAKGDLNAAFAAFDNLAITSAEYRNEVHSHGHWGMLALIIIILGLMFDRLSFSAKQCIYLARLLAASTVLFPLGVLMQIGNYAAAGKFLSIGGSGGIVVGLLLVTIGLLRKPTTE